jgi:hypothetical protein
LVACLRTWISKPIQKEVYRSTTDFIGALGHGGEWGIGHLRPLQVVEANQSYLSRDLYSSAKEFL